MNETIPTQIKPFKGSWYNRTLPKIEKEDTISFEDLVRLPIVTLVSTDDDTFWWKNSKFEERFIHEKARVGARFVDGNNGDKWRVIASESEYKRLIVQNLTQDFIRIVIWE